MRLLAAVGLWLGGLILAPRASAQGPAAGRLDQAGLYSLKPRISAELEQFQ
jgi:hypothetical protein